MKPDYWRQLDFFNPDNCDISPTVIGAGSTGSFIVLGLAAMGFKKIVVIDHDNIDAHNMPNQFFAQSLLKDMVDGTISKVMMLKQTIAMLYPNTELIVYPIEVEETHNNKWFSPIVFSCVDDNKVREFIFQNWQCDDLRGILIDPRTGGEYYNVFVLTKYLRSSDYGYYINSLEGETANLPCTGTSIADVAFAVAASCIQRMREYLKTNKCMLLHTFHDCKTNLTSYMRLSDEADFNDTNKYYKEPDVATGEEVKDEQSTDSDRQQDIA